MYNIFSYNYFSWCGLAQSKVRASPSAPAFTERVNKAIVEQASPAYSDHSTGFRPLYWILPPSNPDYSILYQINRIEVPEI